MGNDLVLSYAASFCLVQEFKTCCFAFLRALEGNREGWGEGLVNLTCECVGLHCEGWSNPQGVGGSRCPCFRVYFVFDMV